MNAARIYEIVSRIKSRLYYVWIQNTIALSNISVMLLEHGQL